MAKAKKTQKSVLKWKKKRWFKVVAPKSFYEKDLGETTALTPEETKGRTVETNLTALTKNFKHKNVNVTFIVTRNTGSICHTSFYKYEISPAIIKRNIRHGKDRIDDSFGILTKDGKKAIIKPLITTRQTTNNSVVSLIRKTCKQKITELAKTKNLSDLVNDIVGHKLQIEMRNILKKIYPLKTFEIRVLKVISPEEEKVEEVKTDEESKEEEN